MLGIIGLLTAHTRTGQPVTFDVTVIPTRNFPVDMYFLMDLSFSTRDNLVNLQKLTAELGRCDYIR